MRAKAATANAVFTELRKRIDRVVLVTAPDSEKIARYVDRISPSAANRPAAEADARSRLALQIPDSKKAPQADYLLENSGDIEALRAQVRELWPRLKQESNLNLDR